MAIAGLTCATCGAALGEEDERCARCGAEIRDHPRDHGAGDAAWVDEDRTPAWVYRTILAVATVAVFVTWLFGRSDVSGALRFGFLVEFLLYVGVVAFVLLRLSRKNRWRERGRLWLRRQEVAMARAAAATRSSLAGGAKGFAQGFRGGERPNFLVRLVFRLVRFGLWLWRRVRGLVLLVWRLARGVLRLAYRIVRWALRLAWRIVYAVLRWWPIRYATRFVEPHVRPRAEPVLLKVDVDVSRLLRLAVPPERAARYDELGLAARWKRGLDEEEGAEEGEDAGLAAGPAAEGGSGDGPAPPRTRRFGLRRRAASGDPAAATASAKLATSPADTPQVPEGVEGIEGIGPVYGERLRALGVASTNDLLAREPAELAAALGEPEATVAKWRWMADLMRLDGVGRQYAEVLARVAVTGIEDLAGRDPKAVAEAAQADAASVDVTVQGNEVTEKRVKAWVQEAKAWLKADAKARDRAAKEAAKDAQRREKDSAKAARADAKRAAKGDAEPIEK